MFITITDRQAVCAIGGHICMRIGNAWNVYIIRRLVSVPHAGAYAIKCNGLEWSCSWPVSWECLRDRRHDFTVVDWFTAMHVAREAVQMHATAQVCCDRPRWSSEKVNNVVTCLCESDRGLKLQFSGTLFVFQNRVENNVMLSVGNRSVTGVYETKEWQKLF
jgi:hypothetical protein